MLDEHLLSDIDACTDKGETPLSVAVWADNPQNVSILLSNGADTSIVDEWGYGALHWAAQWGRKECVSEFIAHHCDLGLPNSFGLTPELVARKYGHEDLAIEIMDYVNERCESHYFTLKLWGLSKSFSVQMMNRVLPHIATDQAEIAEHRSL